MKASRKHYVAALFFCLLQLKGNAHAQSHEGGLAVAFENTALASLYVRHYDAGIWSKGSFTASLDSALLTGAEGFRLEVRRNERVYQTKALSVAALLSTRAVRGRDSAALTRAWGAGVGLALEVPCGSWKLGTEVRYLPTLWTHFRHSDLARDRFADRYPDNRNTLGERTSSLWLGGHRAQAVFKASYPFASRWHLRLRGGLNMSPGAGAEWANVTLGQVPLMFGTALGHHF